MSANDRNTQQLELLVRSEALAKVAREQLGMDISPAAVAMLAQGGQLGEKPGVYSRLKGAYQYLVSGVTGMTWMGPFQPLPAMQDQPEKGVVGRAFDYPVGLNTQIQPRSNEAVNFPTLRALAETYDLMRLAIETCKDQIESFEWEVVPEDEHANADQFKSEIKRVSDFLEYPDREHNWNQWLRMALEDMLVLDAIAIYPQQTRGGDLYSFDLIDPSTIKRVIDEYGRTPVAPSPAYQQVIKGIPAVDYTREQLTYIVRNPRSWKLYGYGPVEQVIMTVSIAMRRQTSQLQFYTEGNVPESLISAPDAWTAEQVKDFQAWWDSTLAGNTGQRRRMHFVPNFKDGKVVLTKGADQLKDDYDEWLARIICFAFSIAPNALIKQMNRAASEQIAVSAKEEGQMPRMKFFASQLNFLLKSRLKMQGVKFKWKIAEDLDPLKQAQVAKIYVDAQVITPDEARQDIGKSPLTPAQREEAWPTPVMEAGVNPDGTPVNPTDKANADAAKAKAQGGKEAPKDPKAKSTPPVGGAGDALGKAQPKAQPIVTAVAKAVAKRERSTVRAINRALSSGADAVAAQAARAYAKAGLPAIKKSLRKADEEDLVLRILNELQVEDVSVDVVDALTDELRAMFKQAGVRGVAQARVTASAEITKHLDKAAAKYAKARGAELVTGLSETTRERLRGVVTEAVKGGWSTQTLKHEVIDSTAFDPDRARMIARTELAFAHVQGNVEGWRETGEVEGKRSVLGDLHDVPDECDECADAGVVPMDDAFVDDYSFPPYHPNCVCDIFPVLRGGAAPSDSPQGDDDEE